MVAPRVSAKKAPKHSSSARKHAVEDEVADEAVESFRRTQAWRQKYDEQVQTQLKDKRQRLISVANRLPCTIHKDKDTGKWVATKSSGGLVSALGGVSGIDMLWIGWPGCEVPDEEKPEVEALVAAEGCYPVFLTDEEIDLYYNGFCNNTLWPLFHYITPPMEGVIQRNTLEWETYQKVNAKFVDAIMNVLTDNDLVWAQDYHLMLVPKLLRERVPNASIGWFLHTPFPSAEIYRMLPQREELLQGLLSANLLAFHVYDYVRHFLSSCRQLTSLEITPRGVDATPLNGNFVRCTAIPIGIDPTSFTSVAESQSVATRVASLKEQWGGRKVILGVDRLDYIKGIPHKLKAFDMFLDEHPEWASQCVLVQLAIPTRSEVPEYKRLQRQVHEMVGSICGKHSNLYTGPPVIYLDGSVDHEELTALYRVADVALITSIRDGMNLVAFEYVASQQHKNGVLVMSEFAGAAQSLGAGSIRINPWNLEEVSSAIYEALTMGEESRKEMHQYCFNYIHAHTAQRWAETFIDTLKDACAQSEEITASVPPLVPFNRLLRSVELSKKRLLVFSLMDCLVPSKTRRGLPVILYQSVMSIPKDLMDSLKHLANDKNTIMMVTTSHSKQVLEDLLGQLPIYLLPENGCIYRTPQGEWKYADALGNSTADNNQAEVEDKSDSTAVATSPRLRASSKVSDNDWMSGVGEVLRYFQERTPGSYIDRTEFSLKWFFDNTRSDFGAIQSRDLMIQLRAGPLANAEAEIVVGNKYIEIRPRDCSMASNLEKILHYEVLNTAEETDVASKVDTSIVIGTYPFRDQDVYQLVEDTLVQQWIPEYTRHHRASSSSVSSPLRQRSSSDCVAIDVIGNIGNCGRKSSQDAGEQAADDKTCQDTFKHSNITHRNGSWHSGNPLNLDPPVLGPSTSSPCLDEASPTEAVKDEVRRLHESYYSVAVSQYKVSKAKQLEH
ncbi:hypothetical protein FOL47_009343 [Perkinsus chesapeaki]|uniref:Trehalose-6-P synthase/phosphatase complex synthase subunit n=1 Tax=Perkinsus chesapeaki TaxID=330153 RepID=A0A7J6L925_PERCH|nr:hypothetical protein FOL47_009343 [Perkinsus chesapeaki]